MSHDNNTQRNFIALNIAVLTVSDSRTEATDKSGKLLVEKLTAAGHNSIGKSIEPDDIYKLRARVSGWIADDNVQAIICLLYTSPSPRD